MKPHRSIATSWPNSADCRPLPRGRALQPSADDLRRLGLLGVPLD